MHFSSVVKAPRIVLTSLVACHNWHHFCSRSPS